MSCSHFLKLIQVRSLNLFYLDEEHNLPGRVCLPTSDKQHYDHITKIQPHRGNLKYSFDSSDNDRTENS